MRAQRALYGLLIVVAAAAAVLSFSALESLARVCGFSVWLAWLLPVVIDAGAAAGTIVWLSRWAPDDARRFARTLAFTLLAGSVAGNALGHGLEAYGARPHWLVLVAVSAIAPAVLGAILHLAVLVRRTQVAQDEEMPGEPPAEEQWEQRDWWADAPTQQPAAWEIAEQAEEIAAAEHSSAARPLAAVPDLSPTITPAIEELARKARVEPELVVRVEAYLAQAAAQGHPTPTRRIVSQALDLGDDHYGVRKIMEKRA